MAKKNGKSAQQRKATVKEPIARIERPLTLMTQVEQTLRRAVKEGVFPGDRLPTTVQLSEQLGVSRETVRLALDSLQRDGLLVKHRRRGTFINPPTVPTTLAPMSTVIGYLQADYSPEGGETEVVTRAISSYMFDGALVEAGRGGFQLVVRSSRIANLRTAFNELTAQTRLRGVIFASIAEEKLLRRLGGLNIPAVLLDHDLHLPKLSSVRPDSFGRSKLAVLKLAEMGHRRVSLAQWHQGDLDPWHLRGYREGMREAGLRCRRVWEMAAPITPVGGAEIVNKILAISPQPTAVICFSNPQASFIFDAASQRGVRIPEELSIVGGGGGNVIGLTCQELDWCDLGRQAMKLLLQAIATGDEYEPEHKVIPFVWKDGRTTCPPE